MSCTMKYLRSAKFGADPEPSVIAPSFLSRLYWVFSTGLDELMVMSPPRTRKRQKQGELKEKWPLASHPTLIRLHAPVGIYLSAPIYYSENDVSKINE